MTNNLFGFTIFWGIWLLVPMLIDGFTNVFYFIGAWWTTRGARKDVESTSGQFVPPFITIIVPVYNGEHTLGPCLESIRNQSYPRGCLQIVVVNNQSTDGSYRVFSGEQAKPFEGMMAWVDATRKGKVWALNTGIHLAHGTIIINVDCDTILHPDAIHHMARAFHAQPDLAAATGSVEVILGDTTDLPLWKSILARCEAFEYLTIFRLGRQYQTATNSIFTLAGAFSAFRREVLLDTFLYDQHTVSEDTKMTLDVRRRSSPLNMRIGAVADAVAFVEPTSSLSKLYAQRVRWQRGQLEVAALHPDLDLRNVFRIKGLSIPRTLMIDHTLAFPRFMWTFLMPLLFLFGYPLNLVVDATVATYAFYAIIEALSMLACYALGDEGIRRYVKGHWYLWAVTPAYRFLLFWFRFGGFLNALTDEAQWRVADPWQETRQGVRQLMTRIRVR